MTTHTLPTRTLSAARNTKEESLRNLFNFRTPLFFVRMFNYEYWTWWMFYIPILPYWLWLSLKSRSLTFFTAANPAIEAGGFFGESKMDILKMINPDYKPKTIFVSAGNTIAQIEEDLQKNKISFPLIAKPNIGERGFNVQKINNARELNQYIAATDFSDFIIQEFVNYELELGVLYHRLPGTADGKVSSVTIKEFLSVTGDGYSSVLELMQQSTRARFQIERLKRKMDDDIHRIPHEGEKVKLEVIGNHCLGTKFINGNHLINEKLHNVFNKIANSIEGFYYGRFDLKVKSLADLYNGENIKIMELNGVSSEPGHIYDPHGNLFNAYRDLMKHWKTVYEISKLNSKNGILPLGVKSVLRKTRDHFFN